MTQSRDQICRHTFVPEFGDIELRIPQYADDKEVLGSQYEGELRKRFLNAIEHEKPYLATP